MCREDVTLVLPNRALHDFVDALFRDLEEDESASEVPLQQQQQQVALEEPQQSAGRGGEWYYHEYRVLFLCLMVCAYSMELSVETEGRHYFRIIAVDYLKLKWFFRDVWRGLPEILNLALCLALMYLFCLGTWVAAKGFWAIVFL